MSDNQFVSDMEDAGYEVEAYRGLFYWTGPAVRFNDSNDLQEIIRATDVIVQWDIPMVYPVNSDSQWYKENEGRGYGDDEDEDEDE